MLRQRDIGNFMIGVYKITNTVNGHFYIGQSTNIERRFMEHKTPKIRPNDNKRLSEEMKIFGKDKFEFEVIEECKKEELLAKELHYIRLLNPYYNTVGKPVSDETRKKISDTVKKWWASPIDLEKKQEIIRHNLKPPQPGHTLSEETKRKISKKVSQIQKVKIKIIETGEEFESIGALEQHLGACTGTVAAYWKGKIKTVKGYHVAKV